MMQDIKLVQMLLTTIVTSRNINHAISNFAKKGTIDDERTVTIAAIQGTLVGFVATLAITWLLASWQSHQQKHEAMKLEEEMTDNEDEVASVESISDDDDDSTTFVRTPPRKFRPRLMALQKDQDMLEEDKMTSTFDGNSEFEGGTARISSSPRKKCSLRLALRKHRGLGSEWKDSGERYSLRIFSSSCTSTWFGKNPNCLR